MAGIYIHIPFCKKACHYCDFHFSTSLSYKNELIDCLLKEIAIRSDYLNGETIQSIYFGGGTPSLLSASEVKTLLDEINKHFDVQQIIECTLEANPDDLTLEKMTSFREAGINRLSIGIQSFFEEDLLFMNRSHNAAQALACITLAREAGFDNFSIDLIFGYPLLSDEKWQQNIAKALQFNIPHLSCYAMTVEPQTALASLIKKKKTPPVNQEQSAAQFEYLMNELEAHDYQQYEISNYALAGKRAVHNSNYWKGIPYLGIGPSAHSFDGNSRQWNVANNIKYMKSLNENTLSFEKELLSPSQKINEGIMTSLRTKEGLNRKSITPHMNDEQRNEWIESVQHMQRDGMIVIEEDTIKLTQKGKLFGDYVAGELFV